jgi:hypothetical protein
MRLDGCATNHLCVFPFPPWSVCECLHAVRKTSLRIDDVITFCASASTGERRRSSTLPSMGHFAIYDGINATRTSCIALVLMEAVSLILRKSGCTRQSTHALVIVTLV